jgi:hypothetical protein
VRQAENIYEKEVSHQTITELKISASQIKVTIKPVWAMRHATLPFTPFLRLVTP